MIITGLGSASESDVTDFISSLDSRIANWDSAYGWGNHTAAGYLTTSHISGDPHTQYALLTGRTGESLKYTGNQFVHGSSNTINSGATIYSVSGRQNVVSSAANIVGNSNTVGNSAGNAAILGNNNSIGNFSNAITIAGYQCSVAASSAYAVAMGNFCTSTAEGGVAVGTNCSAGLYSAALGVYVTASGYDTLALSSYTLNVAANMSIVLAADATGVSFTTDNVFAIYGPTKFGFNVPNPTKDLDWNGQAVAI